MKSITEFLEQTAERYPDKPAFTDEKTSADYKTFTQKAQQIGTALTSLNKRNAPVAIYMNKSVACAESMFGVAYSGNFYIVVDSKMPLERIKSTFGVVNPVAVITEKELADNINKTGFEGSVFICDEIAETPVDKEKLKAVRDKMIDTDPLYCLFTSGSTGVPKGTVISHKNVIAYSEWVVETFDINSETVFGSQTPFYFSMSVTDVFSTIRTGAELVIIPKQYFSFPVKLIEFMNNHKVNTVYWVPSALCIVANLNLFKYTKPEYLKKVLFAGEVMPTKQLNYWISYFPDIFYANLFGPTETTDICTYYVVNRKFEDGESLPIGNACNNCDVMVVNDEGKECKPDEEGELYVRGSFLAAGYYNNPEKTNAVFVQNPLNSAYPETVYKTGDIVKYNEYGELIYCGRKDFQIKHMGYRIELGEIEAAAGVTDGVQVNACLYDVNSDKIILIYQGTTDKDTVLESLKKRVPEYMMPSEIIKIPSMPYNSNGKIDRVWLKNNYKTL
ncbi:MAG: amino acid adenylation domain-containing protein [Acutalibacteraceae bacterium]